MFTIYGECELFGLEEDFNSKKEAMARYENLLAKKDRRGNPRFDKLELVDRATMEIVAAKYNN